MTATANEVDTGLATIEGINLDADTLCDGWGCLKEEHPADYIIGFVWPHGHIYRGARCKQWWMSPIRLHCLHCDESTIERGDITHIVEVLR